MYFRLNVAVEAVTRQQLPSHVKFIELDVCCVDETAEETDVEVPPVKYKLMR